METKRIFSAVLVCAFITLCFADAPQKPVWPEEFDAAFGLNVPATNTSAPIVNATSHFYYKWTDIKGTVIDYSEKCLPIFYPGSEKIPCKVIMTGDAIYLSQGNTCCKLFDGIGSVPPAFLDGFEYAGFDQVAIDLFGVPKYTHLWIADNGFQYWTDITTGADVQFTDGGVLNWNWGPLKVREQNNNIFMVPSGCQKACKASASAESMLPNIFIR